MLALLILRYLDTLNIILHSKSNFAFDYFICNLYFSEKRNFFLAAKKIHYSLKFDLSLYSLHELKNFGNNNMISSKILFPSGK